MGGTHKVFIPTQDYFLLKFMADPPYRPQKPFEYENEYNITGLVAKGNLEGAMARFTALLDVFVNTDKWALIELPFSNVFITALTLNKDQIPVRTAGGATAKNPSFAGQKVIYAVPVTGFGHIAWQSISTRPSRPLPGKRRSRSVSRRPCAAIFR